MVYKKKYKFAPAAENKSEPICSLVAAPTKREPAYHLTQTRLKHR